MTAANGRYPAGKHLVLIGLMGAGKTTVGLECARQLDRDFVDTDDLVTARAQMSVEAIFAEGGELQFRSVEHDVVADVCAAPRPLVVACGGGTVLDPENRRALRARGVVVWLRAPTGTLVSRVGDGTSRPLLRGDPEAALERLGRLRELTYEAAAHASVDTDDLDVDEVARAVIAVFEGRAA
ncbi:MAG TPA: shikimate kinase [Acidimicrobiia bacterium]|jgi:shikimate kinase|nr:shikimate kinase [Acidimicrobiia bacterium]